MSSVNMLNFVNNARRLESNYIDSMSIGAVEVAIVVVVVSAAVVVAAAVC